MERVVKKTVKTFKTTFPTQIDSIKYMGYYDFTVFTDFSKGIKQF